MSQLTLFAPQYDERVRRVEIDGVTYFSIFDVFQHFGSDGSAKNPRKYWERAQERIGVLPIRRHQFQGQGQRETPIAPAAILVRVLASFQPTNLPKEGYVYIVRCTMAGYENLFKIGMTRGLEGRMKSFGEQFPFKPELIFSAYSDHARQTERHLHKMYAAKRVHNEWFRLDGDDLMNIRAILGGAE